MDPCVLFFDTFHHAAEENYIDLVKFNTPVKISELRVIPNDTIVHAGYLMREGRTQPDEVGLDFYARDVEKPEAATFVDLGGFDYSENDVQNYVVEKSIMVDVLLIKGTYKELTLAVIGYTSSFPPTNLFPNQPPMVMRHNVPQPGFSGDLAMVQPPQIADALVSSNEPFSDKSNRPGAFNRGASGSSHPAGNYVKRGIEPLPLAGGDEAQKPQISLPPPLIEIEELNGEPDCHYDDIGSRLSGLEDITSEENFDNTEAVPIGDEAAMKIKLEGDDQVKVSHWLDKSEEQPEEIEYSVDTLTYYQEEREQLTAIVAAAALSNQGAGEHQLSGIGNFVNPSLSRFEIETAKYLKDQQVGNKSDSAPPKEAQTLLSLIEQLLCNGEDTDVPKEGMVSTLEQCADILHSGLAYWHVYSESTFDDLIDSLCEWSITAADYCKNVKLIETSPVLKVRALKAGLNLICQLVTLSPDCAQRVLHDGRIQQNLVDLLVSNSHSQHDTQHLSAPFLTSPLENLVIHTLSHTCVFEQGVLTFVEHSQYLRLLNWLVRGKRRHGKRPCFQRRSLDSASWLLQSISIYELVRNWKSAIEKLSKYVEKAKDCSTEIGLVCHSLDWFSSEWIRISEDKQALDGDVRMMSFCRFLRSIKPVDVILVLLSDAVGSVLSRDSKKMIYDSTHGFLNALSNSKPGLLFLLCNGAKTTQLIHQLVLFNGRLQQVGIDLSYRLLMLQLFDQLVASSSDNIVVLRTLAGLVGRPHCVHLLAGIIASDSMHIDLLIKIVESNLPNVTPEVESVFLLLLAMLNHEPLRDVDQFGGKLINLCRLSDDKFALATEMRSIVSVFEPQTKKSTEDSVETAEPLSLRKLCELLKTNTETSFLDNSRVFSTSLQAILRLIWHIVSKKGDSNDRQIALIELWDRNLSSTLLKLIKVAAQVRLACIQRNCFTPSVQQQMLFSMVDISVNLISAMMGALTPTGFVLIEIEQLIENFLLAHSAFCVIPPSSTAFSLNEASRLQKDLIVCLQEILLLPAKISVATSPPIQLQLLNAIVEKTLDLPLYHLSGLVILADLLSPSSATELDPANLTAIRQTFVASFFVLQKSHSHHHRHHLTQLMCSLYLTDSPPVQTALFRFLRGLASISRQSAIGVLKLTLSLSIDNLGKVASSLRTIDPNQLRPESSDVEDADFGHFVSSPFYAACKALAMVTHLIVASPTTHATLIGEIANSSSDKPFRQIIPDLATLIAGCCRRLTRLSPLSAGEFMLHAFDFYTQLASPNFVSMGGVTHYLPLSTLTMIAECALRSLVGSNSSLSSAIANLNKDLFGDESFMSDLTKSVSSVPSEAQQAAWRLVGTLAEERNGAAIWEVTESHSSCLNQAVMEACEPITSGMASLDEDATALLSEMVMALTVLANQKGCQQRLTNLICQNLGDNPNPIEQLLQQVKMMDMINSSNVDDVTKRVDAASLTERLEQLVATMQRPPSSAEVDSVPASECVNIGSFLEQVFADAPLDPFADQNSDETIEDAVNSQFWWLVAESVHDASCTVETCQRINADLDSLVKKFCGDNVDISNEIATVTSDLVDSITAPGRFGSGTKPGDSIRRERTINTSRQMRRYVAPMRGRGWLGPPSGSGHRAPPPSIATLNLDARGGRAPNTSRPPSMHVDDFQRFERINPTPGTSGYRGSSMRGRGYRGGFRGRVPLLPTPFHRDSKAKSGIEELLAIANDPVVMAASSSISSSTDLTAQQQNLSLLNSLNPAGSSETGAPTLPPLPLPFLQMLPLLPPEEIQKLGASMFTEAAGGSNNDDEHGRRSPNRFRRRSGSSDSDRHRSRRN